MLRMTMRAWLALTVICCAGCASTLPVPIQCPPPPPIPAELAQRPEPERFQQTASQKLRRLLSDVPNPETDWPIRSPD